MHNFSASFLNENEVKQFIASISSQGAELINLADQLLIADDNVFNLYVLKKQLLKLNKEFIIYEARDGKEAIELYENNVQISLIIMDCDMPILNGFQATEKIKAIASERQENVKIIGYSGLMNEEEIKKCKDSGMDECLQKPCPESMLFERVLQQLQNQ